MVLTVILTEPTRRRYGPETLSKADAVTLLRALWVGAVACFIGAVPSPEMAIWVMGITAVALALDGLDGLVARRTHSVSEFGAQLDMELDAVLILVLSVLVWTWDHAGPWVLACGLLRYAWVAGCAAIPWMRQPLPPSFRRKTCCVLGTAGLLGAIGPWSPAAFAATATALLCASFGFDWLWLFRHRVSP